MKFKLAALLTLFTHSFANAQKVDLDRAYASYLFTTLPSSPFPVEYKTFNATAAVASSSANMSAAEIEEGINLEGFHKVSKNEKADLSIQLKFADFMIEGAEVKDRVEITKDKAGNETGRKYYYRAYITYTYSATLKFNNNVLGKELINNVVQSPSSQNLHLSPEYGSRAEAAGYWNNNKETVKSRLLTEAIKGKIEYVNNSLGGRYGYRPSKVNYLFWVQGEKKHPEYELNNKMVEQLKAAALLIKANQPITSEIREAFGPVIAYFNDVKLRFNKEDKNDKKMRYSAFFNLGFIYVMLENYPAARKEAEGLNANDYDKNDSKDIIRQVDIAEEQLKLNNTDTRHFVSKRMPVEEF